MNAPAPVSATQDRTTAIVYGVVGSLIATALVAGGAWLAARQVPDETVLQFSYSESKVGKLSAWYVRISNSSDVAFDVQIAPPVANVIRFEYSQESGDGVTWKGQIAKGHTIDALFINEGSSVRLSPSVIQASITATYQERNPLTGAIESRTGEVRDATAVPLARTVMLVLWFFLPMFAASVLLLLPKGWKWLRQRFNW